MTMDFSNKEVEDLYFKLNQNAKKTGCFLNSDSEIINDILGGLITNEARYGYLSCPCRLSEGEIERDKDLVCPCDYREDDLFEFGSCYCGLYISAEIQAGSKRMKQIPERRGKKISPTILADTKMYFPLPVFRCKVCGYLCARNNPPGVCPICNAKSERFERFV